jgi:precorrin-2/cobalt-factor-2 C20-methyltransferase
MSASGKLIGVGVGPGDPELMTLKAVRTLQEADVVAYFAKAGRASLARTIAADAIKAGALDVPLPYPVTTEIPKDCQSYIAPMRDFYDGAAKTLAAHLDAGRRVAVLCEGDPLFYGSYMHLHVRLAARYPTEVIAGVSGMAGCWSAVGETMAQGDDVMMIIPATLAEAELARRLADADAAVVMKLGRNLPKVRGVLKRIGRIDRAIYVERATTSNAVSMRLAAKKDDDAPYFSIVLVPGWEKRP